jgi:hypothetical protein
LTSSSRRCDDVDFARDVPTSAEDVAALRRAREPRGSLEDLLRPKPDWPPPPDPASRPTAAGRAPFEL